LNLSSDPSSPLVQVKLHRSRGAENFIPFRSK
jgi:hypothetical protein